MEAIINKLKPKSWSSVKPSGDSAVVVPSRPLTVAELREKEYFDRQYLEQQKYAKQTPKDAVKPAAEPTKTPIGGQENVVLPSRPLTAAEQYE